MLSVLCNRRSRCRRVSGHGRSPTASARHRAWSPRSCSLRDSLIHSGQQFLKLSLECAICRRPSAFAREDRHRFKILAVDREILSQMRADTLQPLPLLVAEVAANRHSFERSIGTLLGGEKGFFLF